MAVVVYGDLQFGAHTVGAGHQDRILIALWQLGHGGETAQTTQQLGSARGLGSRRDAFNQLSARLDVDTGILVGEAATLIGCVAIGSGHGELRWEKPAVYRLCSPRPKSMMRQGIACLLGRLGQDKTQGQCQPSAQILVFG